MPENDKDTRPTTATTVSKRPSGKSRTPSRQTRKVKKKIDLGDIEDLRILNEQGIVDTALDPDLPASELMRIYRAMVLARKLDQRMLAMQRQGEMGTFAPGLGQEATQIGQIFPLQPSDWFVPSYRSFGAQLLRGWTIEGLMLLWDGYFQGFEIPEGVNDLPFSIVVGSHPAPAVGLGMAIRQRGESSVVLTNFGDGALSQGPVAEAFNFAVVSKAPVVFVVENNGYAISIPVAKQSGLDVLAKRGTGFGMHSIRVDGNDVLAMIVATNEAVERGRRGDGPTLIEAVTYRVGLHTTADDPKVYRSDDEVEQWEKKCPIARLEKFLMTKGLLDRDSIEQTSGECEKQVLDGRERFRSLKQANPREVFDYVFESLPTELETQKKAYLDKLDRRGVE